MRRLRPLFSPKGSPMHRYRDLRITSRTLDASQIIAFIVCFAQSAEGWSFPKEKSEQYAEGCGGPSCCLIHEPTASSLPRAAIHVTNHRRYTTLSALYVPNIIPLTVNKISVEEYNAIALHFAHCLRLRARAEDVAIRVALSKENVGLRDIIGGKISWRLFNQYISLFPESFHPNDLARLDAFTCSVSRNSRRYLDLDLFEVLLRDELGWSKMMASRCRGRVEIGLAVLAVNRKYR